MPDVIARFISGECVCVCFIASDIETSTFRRSRPNLGNCATTKNMHDFRIK